MNRERMLLLTAVIVAACCTLLFLSGFFQYRMTDVLYGAEASPNIVIVGIDDKSLQEIGRWPWDRRNFSALIENIDGAGLIGVDVAFLEQSTPEADAALAASLVGKEVVLVSEYIEFDRLGKGTRLLAPVQPIDAETGYANIVADRDGVVRSLNLAVGDEPAFSAALYEAYTDDAAPATPRYLINFAAPGAYTRYSASDVIAGRVPAEAFKDRIVLIGAVAPDFHDDAIVPTSGGKPMPGVEIHANALQTMIAGTELHAAHAWLTIILMLFAISVVLMLVQRFHAVIAGLAALGIIIAYVIIAVLLFERMVLDIFYIPFAIILSFIAIVTVDLVNERKAKRKVADAFGRYVSPDILKRIMDQSIELGGERREVTILFSDIRGFTSISERLTPEDLVDFLNSYFTKVTRIIMERHGLVDKFIGDAIMAFWNAPLDDAGHAAHAVEAALAMRDALEDIRAEHGERYPRLDVGIGINTGNAILGNIGSIERLSYTAIGDSVNLASRLEGLTKEYGVHILISENTKRELKGGFVLRQLDRVKVKGKKEPVTIYEVVGKSAAKERLSAIKAYERGLRHYYKGEWEAAIAIFWTLEDKASALLRSRCEEFLKESPAHWDGAYEMTHK